MEGGKRILVIGDVMLDIYVQGTAKRLSPEAPCVVLCGCEAPINKLGGASNVAYQLLDFNNSVYLCGRIGNDICGKEIINLSQSNKIDIEYLIVDSFSTTTKTRYLSESNHQLLRVDDDCIAPIPQNVVENLRSDIANKRFDAIVLSDYAKGVLSDSLCESIIEISNQVNIPTIIDVKCAPFHKFQNATLIKGNEKEIMELAASLNICSEDKACIFTDIASSLNCRYVVMTMGRKGIVGFSHEDGFVENSGTDIPIHDVTGAGDVVTAIITLLLANKYSFPEILRLSNKAAQYKVSQLGTGRVSLKKVIDGFPKLVDDIDDIISKRNNRSIVFTNGCFDVLHAGHIDLLTKAKQYGDVLVVGLNSDSSISGNKGTHRPVNQFENRVAVLSALECVDFIVKFDEPTPINLITDLRPDVLVKGGDYTHDSIVGADFVENNGGKVIIVPITVPTSSTNILKQMGYE